MPAGRQHEQAAAISLQLDQGRISRVETGEDFRLLVERNGPPSISPERKLGEIIVRRMCEVREQAVTHVDITEHCIATWLSVDNCCGVHACQGGQRADRESSATKDQQHGPPSFEILPHRVHRPRREILGEHDQDGCVVQQIGNMRSVRGRDLDRLPWIAGQSALQVEEHLLGVVLILIAHVDDLCGDGFLRDDVLPVIEIMIISGQQEAFDRRLRRAGQASAPRAFRPEAR